MRRTTVKFLKRNGPTAYAQLSIVTSLVTMTLKFGAWFMTDSVSILSDAAEGVINLIAGVIALSALRVAMLPADKHHAFGHGKAEYLSSGAEGVLIVLASIGIISASVQRFLHPMQLSNISAGLAVALAASLLNFGTARLMLRGARHFDSITLEADARHLLTDVWTSVGLVAGLGVLLVVPPRWHILDPVIAVVMASNIFHSGYVLIRRSLQGLMDHALPDGEVREIGEIIASTVGPKIEYHDLRTRKSGACRHIEFHLLFEGGITLREAHEMSTEVENNLLVRFPASHIAVHLEPLDEDRHALRSKRSAFCTDI